MREVDSWKLSREDRHLAQVLKCIPEIKSQKVVHRSLNNSVYVQQIGPGEKQLKLTIFVESQDEILAVDECNAGGVRLSVRYKDTTYAGIIDDELINWNEEQPGTYYTAEITFMVLRAVKDVL